MTKEQLLGVLRSSMLYFSGILVGKGYLGADDANMIIGGLLAVANIVWSWQSNSPSRIEVKK